VVVGEGWHAAKQLGCDGKGGQGKHLITAAAAANNPTHQCSGDQLGRMMVLTSPPSVHSVCSSSGVRATGLTRSGEPPGSPGRRRWWTGLCRWGWPLPLPAPLHHLLHR
jgi:hypothetical protein